MKYAPTLLVNVTVNAAVLNVIVSLIVAVDRFHAVSLYFTYTVFTQSHALHHAHASLVILKVFVVQYVSAVVHALLLQLNLICVTQFVSLADKVNVVTALFVADAHKLILIAHVGNTVSYLSLIHISEPTRPY